MNHPPVINRPIGPVSLSLSIHEEGLALAFVSVSEVLFLGSFVPLLSVVLLLSVPLASFVGGLLALQPDVARATQVSVIKNSFIKDQVETNLWWLGQVDLIIVIH